MISDAKEIMALFPTVSSVQSSCKLPLLQQLMTAIENNIKSNVNNDDDLDGGIKIRLIIPFDNAIDEITQKFRHNKGILVNYVDEIKEYSIDRSVLLIIDKKISIIIGINEQDGINNNNDGNKNNCLLKPKSIFLYNKDDNDASKSAVISQISAFEIIWNQADTKTVIENRAKGEEDYINVSEDEFRRLIHQKRVF